MEREWKSLTTEEYILIKHCGLTRQDVADMTAEERGVFIELLREERDEENRAAKRSQNAAPNSPGGLPSR